VSGTAPRRLLFLVTEDWYFCSHRLGLARAAIEAGYEVAVACRVDRHGEKITAVGIRLFPLALSRRSLNPFHLLAAIWRIRRLYRDFAPDVVHHVALKPAILGSFAARLAGCRHVVNAVAGFGFVFSSTSFKARLLRPVMTAALRLLLDGRGYRTIVQNDDDAKTLISRGIVAPDHIVVIRGAGVDLSRFRAAPEPQGPVRVTMVSRMIAEKGVRELVAAARVLKSRNLDVRITLAGTPDAENPSAIPESELAAWAREGIVEYLGHVADVAALWRESHVAALPSYYGEGVPLSLIEAAAAGRPLIAADGPGLRDIVRHGETGLLVPPRDADALADALATLVRDPGLRQRLGSGARQLAENAFADSIVQTQTLSLYGDLTAQ
jgi:glycosyltransferase involved in cell wall biosynthesis